MTQSDTPAPQPHYATANARRADLVIHLAGLVAALFGGGVLLGLSLGLGRLSQAAAIGVYSAGLLLMLALSTAYNFSSDRRRPLLRRFDHAGIFVMIAGSYTPFTTHVLTGAWAWGMTGSVWAIAGLGVVAKLFAPGLGRRFWIGIYLALGWIVLVAIRPIIQGLQLAPLILLAVGGALYTSGIIFYVNKRLTFCRAIWHGHIVAAAGLHWAAVLTGVVLATAR
jgi:hemolysin III